MQKPHQLISVGIITHSYFPRLGGTEYATHYLASAINKLPEAKASVACSSLPEINRYYPYAHPVYRSFKLWRITPLLSKLNAIHMVKKEKVNILLGQNLVNSAKLGIMLKQKYALPLVFSSRGSDVQKAPEIHYGETLQPEKQKLVQTAINQADQIIALSKINASDLMDMGCSEHKITIIPNGVLWEQIQNISHENMRKKYGISTNDFVLISVGRNSPVKNLPLLFEAIAKAKNPQIKCICVGPEKDLGRLATIHGIQNQVILTGKIPATYQNMHPPYPELINLYRAANYYVSTSYVDCFSNAAIEALAAGTPIIIGKKHGVRDIINSKTGIVMDNENPTALAELLNYLANNTVPQDKTVIAQSVKHLSWENIATQHLNIYRKLV